MNQGLLFSSSSILLATVFGVAALFAGSAVPLDAPEMRGAAQAWTAQALGSYQRNGGDRVSFEDGIASPMVGVEPQADRDSIVNAARIDRGARQLPSAHTRAMGRKPPDSEVAMEQNIRTLQRSSFGAQGLEPR